MPERIKTKKAEDEKYLITLPRGNKLFYRIKGNIRKKPVLLFFGGFPSTTNQIDLDEDDRVSFIAIDRPGLGDSPYDENFSFNSFVQDAHFILKKHNIKKVSLFTTSGGGPFGLCFANKYPEMVNKVGMFAAVAPFNKVKYTYCRMRKVPIYVKNHYLLRKDLFMDRFQVSIPLPIIFLWQTLTEKSLLNKQILSYYNIKYAVKDLAEGYKQGFRSLKKNVEVYHDDWGFDICEVLTPVKIYHAKTDFTTQVEATMFYEKTLKNVEVTYVEGETHGAIMILYYKEMISWLLR